MADIHSRIMKQVQLDWSRENRGRLFPNQSGKAWRGEILSHTHSGLKLYNPKMIKYGLENGSSDLIGFLFVGGLPVFCSIEVKTEKYKKLSLQQINWLNFVVKNNGVAFIAKENKNSYVLERWEIKE